MARTLMREVVAAGLFNPNPGGAGQQDSPTLKRKTNPYSRPGDKGKERNDG